MRASVTSKEEILKVSRELIQRQGWSAVNIRSVAAACGVSVGAVYNYFQSKEELVSGAIESIWFDIFCTAGQNMQFHDVLSCIQWIYQRMEYGNRTYPGFITLHSVAFVKVDKREGKQRMQRSWQHIQRILYEVLKQDQKIRSNAFDEHFTAEQFAQILFSLMLSALIRQDYDPSIVLEIVKRTLYESK